MSQIQVFCQKKLNGIIIYNKNDDYIKKNIIFINHSSSLFPTFGRHFGIYGFVCNASKFKLFFFDFSY